MNPRFYSTPIGNELPEGSEVVWNGTHDKLQSHYWQAQAQGKATHPGFGQPQAARWDTDSTRACDRILRHLVTHPALAHTAKSVGEACAVSSNTASAWLGRFVRRGVLETWEMPRGFMGAASGNVYRVRPLPTP